MNDRELECLYRKREEESKAGAVLVEGQGLQLSMRDAVRCLLLCLHDAPFLLCVLQMFRHDYKVIFFALDLI